jgi:trafficking protein particle complex subunit 2
VSLFPAEQRDPLEFSFLLSSCLDIFEARAPHKTADQDFGLLQAVDERLAMYGWLTNTGVKIVIVVDMAARVIRETKSHSSGGFRESELKGVRYICYFGSMLTLYKVFKAVQLAYINLLRNPFYMPDEPSQNQDHRIGSAQITSPAFVKEIKRIAESWTPETAT